MFLNYCAGGHGFFLVLVEKDCSPADLREEKMCGRSVLPAEGEDEGFKHQKQL